MAAAKGVITNKTTGVAARFIGEVAHAVAACDQEQTIEVLDALVEMSS